MAAPRIDNDPVSRIETAISSMHLSNRTVASAYGTGLGLAESAVLFEVLGVPTLTGQDLSKRLLLSPVAVTRAIDKLEEDGLVIREKQGRSLRLTVTEAGREHSENALARAREIFSEAYNRLTRDQQRYFPKLLSKMLDALDAPPAVSLPGDPPLMYEIRRMFRAVGFLAQTVYGFREISTLEWHILRCIKLNDPLNPAVRASDLARIIGVSENTVFPAVRRLVTQGLLKQTRGRDDARERTLALKPTGTAILQKCRRVALALLRRGSREFSEEDLERYAAAWSAYSGVSSRPQLETLNDDRHVILVDSEATRQLARRAIILGRAETGMLENIPSVIGDARSRSYLVVRRGVPEVVMEVLDGVILHLLEAHTGVPDGVLERFLDSVRKDLRGTGMGLDALVAGAPPGACSPRIRQLAVGVGDEEP